MILILGHLDLVHGGGREEELLHVRGWILRNLADNGAHGIGDCSVEDDRTHANQQGFTRHHHVAYEPFSSWVFSLTMLVA